MKDHTTIEFRSDTAITVAIAGAFNDWCGSAKGAFNPSLGAMTLKEKGLWAFSTKGLAKGRHEFKFIVDGEWESGPNRSFSLDENGKVYDPTGGIEAVILDSPTTLRVKLSALISSPTIPQTVQFTLKPHGQIKQVARIEGKNGNGDQLILTCSDINLSDPLQLDVKGLGNRPLSRPILFDGIFKQGFISEKPLGVTAEGDPPVTIFRVFSPRARSVTLRLFSDPYCHKLIRESTSLKDADGVWETRLHGTFWGTYYGYLVDGPHGEGEGFQPKKLWVDPYARATVHHQGPGIIIHPDGHEQEVFVWSDQDFTIPPKNRLIIWECSVRDLSSHETSQVHQDKRGKYLGLASTIGTGSGIDHARRLGVNALEFLPVQEFDDDPPGAYHWGYMTSNFFSPEASYATHPRGVQTSEFKTLVNALHGQGLAVILDVVYNHTGNPNHLMGFDRKYFYRHNGDLSLQNFSGCGNDFQSENPMARRLILDSLEYWVREYHIDGFRFDLAELIDDETLHQIEKRLLAIKPGIILIHEPWSFRGTNKGRFKKTAWASWNDDFRNRVKAAALGRAGAADLWPVLKGGVDLWTDSPWESVNYVESHDDYTLTDFLTENHNRDGSSPNPLEIRRNLFCAAATLLSPGIPMLAQGQEMLRSKRGNGNSYNAGDGVNAVDYSLRDRNRAAYSFYSDLIAFRQSAEGQVLRDLDGEACRHAYLVAANNPNAAGILWTSPSSPDKRMLILFNPDAHQKVSFHPVLPPGIWYRLVAEGRVVSRASVYTKQLIVSPNDPSPTRVEVGPLDVQVWVLK